ncbi:hypothetical protein CPB97_008284 [Podila verticillata]|nr:hypothetical protein CPB97_008284 [Podila verticillata]
MSNILTPIVARYSVFFTLTMFSSSQISRAKQPTHLVQDLMLAAEQRFKDRTTKMRALNRNVSTSTSTSSSSSNTRTSTSITTATDSEPPSSPPSSKCMSSFPAGAEAGSSSTPSLLPLPTTSDAHCGARDGSLSHVLTTQTHIPSSPLTLAHSSLGLDIGPRSTDNKDDTFATVTATPVHAHAANVEADVPALSEVNDTLPKNHIKKMRSASIVSKTSIATLLSVTLTMILLSLLQGKKRHARRQRRSLKRNHSRHHSKHHHLPHSSSSSLHQHHLPHSSSSSLHQQNHTIHMDCKNCTSLTQSLQDEKQRTYTIAAECHADQEPTPLNSTFGPTRSSPSPVDTNTFEIQSGPYGGAKGTWSLSDGHLPGKRSKQDFVDAWLEEQRHGMEEHQSPYSGPISPSWTGSEESLHVEEERVRSLSPVHNIPDHHQYTQSQHGDINRRAQEQYEPSRPNNEIYQGSLLPVPYPHRHQHLHPHHHPRPPPQQHHHLHNHPNHHHLNYRTMVPKGDQLGYYYYQPQPHGGRPHAFSHPHGNIVSQDNLRRSLSLTHAPRPRHSPSMLPVSTTSVRLENLTPAEKARHEYQMRRELQQIQHQQHRQHQIQQQYQGYPVPRHLSLSKDAYPPKQYSSRGRSANDLAWERHSFYQQQQYQDEIIAERKRKEEQPRHQLWQLRPTVQEQDLVARTSSLNRITSSSLSPKTAQALGLSRSKTVSGLGERKRVNVVKRAESSATSKPSKGRTFVPADLRSSPQRPSTPPPRPPTPKEAVKSILADCPVFSAGMRLMRRSDSKANMDKSNKDQPSSNDTTPILTRKKTLKDLGPSLKSLARRYSARLNRPNSFAGSSSDPIVVPEGQAVKTYSLMTRTSYSRLSSNPATLSDGVVDLQQLQQSGYLSTERVPIHRRVTLFRPEMMTPSSPTSDSNDQVHNNQTSSHPLARTRSLCSSIKKRDSLTLRFANGRGLELTKFEPPKAVTTTESANFQQSATALQGALPSITNVSPTEATTTTTPGDEQEWTRRQVVAILAMGRKERVSAKTGQSMSSSAKAPLSPLALEAQEDLEVAPVQQDPCEQISFMLVPKSRYEFQPLVAV